MLWKKRLKRIMSNTSFLLTRMKVSSLQAMPTRSVDEATVPNPKIPFQGQTYRVMWISRSEFQRYEDAELVYPKDVTSKSAKGLINCVELLSPNMISVILIYDINPLSSLFALNIREHSKFPAEEEVLILPGHYFTTGSSN